jgi:hypothetical protein
MALLPNSAWYSSFVMPSSKEHDREKEADKENLAHRWVISLATVANVKNVQTVHPPFVTQCPHFSMGTREAFIYDFL